MKWDYAIWEFKTLLEVQKQNGIREVRLLQQIIGCALGADEQLCVE